MHLSHKHVFCVIKLIAKFILQSVDYIFNICLHVFDYVKFLREPVHKHLNDKKKRERERERDNKSKIAKNKPFDKPHFIVSILTSNFEVVGISWNPNCLHIHIAQDVFNYALLYLLYVLSHSYFLILAICIETCIVCVLYSVHSTRCSVLGALLILMDLHLHSSFNILSITYLKHLRALLKHFA